MWKTRASIKFPARSLITSLLFATVFISACSGLNQSDKPATTTWWLDALGEGVSVSPTDPAVKVDVTVTVVPGLDTHRILTLSNNAELNKYAGARWADSLPELVGSLVSRSLVASGRFEIVSSRGGTDACDLELEVQEFYARLDAGGHTTGTQVAMDGFYRCDGAESVRIQLNASAPVHDDRMAVIVAAFQGALDEVTKGLLNSL